MASTKAGRISARSTAGKVFDSDTVDRTVNIYVEGHAEQLIGFSSGDVATTTSGFRIPASGAEFVLQAGDELWLTGQTSQDASYVYYLVTKV